MFKQATKALHILKPEAAHTAAIKSLKAGIYPRVSTPSLPINVFDLDFPNPVGLAAGFDKNAETVDALFKLGFGFIEIGAVTPRPQPGNPKPRLFRLSRDRAAINRFGFNNDGLSTIKARLQACKNTRDILGVNLGANKETEDKTQDYIKVLEGLIDDAHFFTVNVSSPNTAGLRDQQHGKMLRSLLKETLAARNANAKDAPPPILLKIAPDLTASELAEIAEICLKVKIDGVITTNTTVSMREAIYSPHRNEMGGLSGAPLFDLSTKVLHDFYALTKGKIPLIGVGGISNAIDAYAKIRAGASLVQIYTAMIYEGPLLGAKIATELKTLVEKDGFATVTEAVGADHH